MYKIRLYNRHGDCIGERFARTLTTAEIIRERHLENIGLDKNKIGDFAYFPTIWEKTESGYKRLLGY